MEQRIIISINPEYFQKIISGEKKYEYRTRIAKRHIDKMIIYVTYPIKKIVAEVEVLDILKLSPKELWELTKTESGVTIEFFNKYFKNRTTAFAYKLGKVKLYDRPIDLSEYGLKNAPQCFMYLNYISVLAK